MSAWVRATSVASVALFGFACSSADDDPSPRRADVYPSGPDVALDLPAVGRPARIVDGTMIVGEGDLSVGLAAWGRVDALVDVDAVAGTLAEAGAGTRWELDRGDLVEWWVGLGAGAEQGWDVPVPPPGSGPLVFDVAVGDAAISAGARGVRLTDATGAGWRVAGLAAWDARGRDLPAEIRVEGDVLRITVDDAGAEYPVTVDPTYTTTSWTVRSSNYPNYGGAMGAAGDVNGDGYPDAIVVATTLERAWIYQGSSAGLSTVPAATLDEVTTARAAGDVDGDGYGDIIAGSWEYNERDGAAWVFLGGAAGLDTAPATTIVPSFGAGYFGYSVNGAGDVNGDGYDDVIVGAPRKDRAYVYYGSSGGVSSTTSTSYSGTRTYGFGSAVGSAGDVDGDGFGDVYIGQPADGIVFVYRGSVSGLSTTATRVGGRYTQYGGSVATADLEADGYSDLLVGCAIDDDDTCDVLVYRGSAAGITTTVAATLDGYTYSGGFGASIANAGDVNGDGYDDVVVGEPVYSTGTGHASIFHGSATGIRTSAATQLVGAGTSQYFGSGVAGPGDVDGDGYADVLVGARWADSDGTTEIFTGSAVGVGTASAETLYYPDVSLESYVRFASGDLDGDGYDELILGSANSKRSAGMLHVFAGSADGLATKADSRRGTGTTGIGADLATGDFNGDGYADLATNTTRGGVQTFAGSSAGMSTTYGTAITGLGYWLSFATADFDGDGYDDLVAGDYTGKAAYMYRGSSAGLASTATRSFTGTTTYFGRAVAAGDTNGDGYVDLALSGDSSTVLLFRGTTTGLPTTATRTLSSSSAFSGFGGELSFGDADGDGYADLAVCSAYGASIYYGSSAGTLPLPDTEITGLSGVSVTTSLFVGDADADGYDDLLLPKTSSGETALLFHGSASGLSTTGEAMPEGGYPLGTGDFDGNGSADPVTFDYIEFEIFAFLGDAVDADGDGVDTRTDCDDADATSYPGAAEACDGADNDCDGTIDEGSTWYTDADGDGYGSGSGTISCTAPAATSLLSTDCDDTDSSVSPGIEESCDGADNDCDGVTDEAGAHGGVSAYPDADGDGYGAGALIAVCSLSGYALSDGDCDDEDPDAWPGTIETCDDVDDDCDGTVDESDAFDVATWYRDADGDGYGTPSTSKDACDAPTGYVASATDCDDGRAAVRPSATETCNSVDDDCDGSTDESVATTFYADADGDGYGDASTTTDACSRPTGYVTNSTDCDDTRTTASPAAKESCNGEDDNCDGTVDESTAYDVLTWYRDVDGDGYGNATTTSRACEAPPGYAATSSDCDDRDATINPGAAELCDDADQDCDAAIDEGIATTSWYRDADGDGIGNARVELLDCSAPSGYVATAGDCNDGNASVGGGAWYADADADGYGDPEVSSAECTAPAGYVADDTDCDDTRAASNPGASEVWYDGIDEDCDGSSDDDQDGDGYDADTAGGTDCDDTLPDVHPGGSEAWYDGIDGDCDGASDDDADGDGYDDALHGGDDCDDGDDAVHPGAPDDPYDGVVTDCDATDENDRDRDGYGVDLDCADADATVHPMASETWYDGIDQDCDGNDDDQDEDGVSVAADCDDTDPAVRECPTKACSTAGRGGWAALLGGLLLTRVRRRSGGAR